MGLTKRFITEMFGSNGDHENKSRVRMVAKFLRWGAIAISMLFVIGYMGYEVGMTTGLIEVRENDPVTASTSAQPTIDELLTKHGAKIDHAIANGSLDRVLNERGVPVEMHDTIKEQIRKRNAPLSQKSGQ